MTATNVTPTENTNEPKAPQQPIDNMGNPVDAEGNPVEPTDNTPAPEGGETLESLQKALKDTKAELTKLQQGQAEPKEEEPAPAEEPAGDLEIKTKEAEDAGVDFTKYSAEYNESGELSEDSYKDLAAKGFDKQIVDDYIAGQKARNDQQTAQVAEVVGGAENLQPVLDWAAEHLSEEEISAYNTATQTGTAGAKLALQGLYSRFTAAEGQSPDLLAGQAAPGGKDVYKSQFEMTKAMQDPRYWNDPDYQAEVADKTARSHKAGTI